VISAPSASVFPELVGEGAAMRSVRSEIGRVLELDLPLLVEGETGTGKSLVARLLHERGPRRGGPLVIVNCAASDHALRGAERVARSRRGAGGRGREELLRTARAGTLFLDEVAELDEVDQRRLLSIVEHAEGPSAPAVRQPRPGARIIVASSASVEAAVASGRFRRDLYYRLCVLTLRMPALRERREDLPLLAENLLGSVCRRLATPAHHLSVEALEALASADWPGNVRQLIHELERAVVACDGLEIGVGHLSPEIRRPPRTPLAVGRRSGVEAAPAADASVTPTDLAVDDLLRRLAGAPASDAAPRPERPASVPGYRLIERIAEGGMGEVWRAEQREPIRREVALKLIRAGMDARGLITRFEAERQALALMDHPAIPKVLSAGSTEQGRPYLVMEYVRGVSLDQHCDQERLPVRARLELFRQVCAGVEHAHRKAILHRDLKPANVLVAFTDGKPQAKIVDFGIAKALAQPLTEKALQTEVGQIVGTLEYMSPEQADLTPGDVDTRSDVYSLGVMLYQLLSGFLPFSGAELRKARPEELRRQLRDVDPPPPGARLDAATEEVEAIARRRGRNPRELRREIEGDLETIVMKALEKDRTRRYESAAELSADLGRYLEGQPVLARRARASTRLSRLWSRHRTLFTMGASVLLLVVDLGFLTGVMLQLRRSGDAGQTASWDRTASCLSTGAAPGTPAMLVALPGRAGSSSPPVR